jgi:hypothetical protein
MVVKRETPNDRSQTEEVEPRYERDEGQKRETKKGNRVLIELDKKRISVQFPNIFSPSLNSRFDLLPSPVAR